jgi:hypothetical protein
MPLAEDGGDVLSGHVMKVKMKGRQVVRAGVWRAGRSIAVPPGAAERHASLFSGAWRGPRRRHRPGTTTDVNAGKAEANGGYTSAGGRNVKTHVIRGRVAPLSGPRSALSRALDRPVGRARRWPKCRPGPCREMVDRSNGGPWLRGG